jgi:hypothetical protein
MFLPDATPSKLEIEAALEVIQAWWSQGTDDPSLQNCLFKRFSCLQPTRSAPDDKSVMPFLYYFSLKLTSEQSRKQLIWNQSFNCIKQLIPIQLQYMLCQGCSTKMKRVN